MGRSLKPNPKERPRRDSKRQAKGLTPLTSQMEEFVRDISRRDDTPLEPLTESQARYIGSIRSNQLTFGMGPAGTGKSFIAASLAADALLERQTERIIITRPVVEAGEELGFLPGELEEKVQPYFAPIRAILERRMGRGAVECMVKAKRIEFMPLAFMRGHTLDDAWILLDEAQNTTPTQMKLFLTRLGEHSTIIIDGDLSQRDIAGPSGMADAMRRLQGVPKVGFVTFTHDDVVRSGLVADILRAYEHEIADEDRAGLETFLANAK